MDIAIVAPIRPGSTSGNDVTAARWARRLRELGHRADVLAFDPAHPEPPSGAELVVALHARRCAGAVAASKAARIDRPVVVGLAGTDLYLDLPDDPDARASIASADRLVVLQPAAVDRLAGLDPALAAKAHVVHQAVEPPLAPRAPDPERFLVAVLAHLRDVKDPLLAARAVRDAPAASRIAVEHAGASHTAAWEQATRAEMRDNPRYRWLGEVSRPDALALLGRSHVLACTSTLEGGANVVTEAIAHGVPVVGTRIDGTVGLLGADYPALVPVGDHHALGAVLANLEADHTNYSDLVERIEALEPITQPAHERRQWAEVLAAL